MNQATTLSKEQMTILNRLHSAEGHLRGVIGMFEAGRPCEQVLHQLQAVEAALGAVGRALRACEFQQDADIILQSDDPNSREAALCHLLTLYKLPIHHFTEQQSDE
ncbi:MAG: metal-sensitive transcriptional regulator [Anaerolineae bacterium]|nr:metal-sensitive transcriptional regulator [Anaerolineae bacterium]